MWIHLAATPNHMGVCDAFAQNAPTGKLRAMSAPHLPKVAGINSSVPGPAQTAAAPPALSDASGSDSGAGADGPHDPDGGAPAATGTGPAAAERLAGRVSDLTTLHDLTERLAATATLEAATEEVLRAGAALAGARRGLVVVEPPAGPPSGARATAAPVRRPSLFRGLGLSRAELGLIETVPRSLTAYGRILDERPARTPGGAGPEPVAHPDLLGDGTLDARRREVAVRLGLGAAYTQPLGSRTAGILGAAVLLYDGPGEPSPRHRRLLGLYARYAAEHLARLVELEEARHALAAVTEELLPARLPRVPGVRLAARHLRGTDGGGDWYDALPLPEGALGLAVGSVSGSGAGALAAMGRLRASLRAYAVMEGEDPVAVLSDLELLLRLTEPARTATALFAYAEPAAGRLVLAGAGHTPPLVIGERRTEFVETSLSAPLGMLACWEAPSVELSPESGETVLLYTDGLLRRTGDDMDRAFARLHRAAAGVPKEAREDPGALVDHVLGQLLPGDPAGGAGTGGRGGSTGRRFGDGDDAVLLAVRFD
jgi:hypothetical protein